jgi:hypothetical protein
MRRRVLCEHATLPRPRTPDYSETFAAKVQMTAGGNTGHPRLDGATDRSSHESGRSIAEA